MSDYGAHKEACQHLLLFYSHKQGKLVSLKEYVEAMAEGKEKIYYDPGESKDRSAPTRKPASICCCSTATSRASWCP